MDPLLVAIDMGYGHLRPAHALADRLGVAVLEADRPPLADTKERRLWRTTRRAYESATRTSQRPILGGPFRLLLDTLTDIPELAADLSQRTLAVKALQLFIRRGLGRGMLEHLRASGAPLLTTFYTPAIIADGCCDNDITCVVTDADINRVWAPADSAHSRIRYLVPSQRAVDRLCAYGIPAENIELTGFPLPHELLGGPDLPTLRHNLAKRLVRLDRRAHLSERLGDEIEHALGPLPTVDDMTPRLTFAVGGAGTQTGLVAQFLPSLAPALRAGRLRLTLVAGVRLEVAERFRGLLRANRLTTGQVEILYATDFVSYVRAFNELLARTDILWTKPSEITFFAALGLPLVFSQPIGVHESYNRQWALEHGAGLVQRDPRCASEWLEGWLDDGTLAAAAWSGFRRLPKLGLYEIVNAISGATPTLTGADAAGDQMGDT